MIRLASLWDGIRMLPVRLRDLAGVFQHALRRFWYGNDFQAAASLTYTTLLAMVPLLTVTFAIFSAFPAYSRLRQQAQDILFDYLVPQVSVDVQAYIDQFVGNAAALTGFGVIGLSVTAILLFFSIEGALNTIWRTTEPRAITLRLLSFWAVLTMFPMLMGASLSLSSSVLGAVRADQAIGVVRIFLPGLMEAIALSLMYLTIPNRDVGWFDGIAGGVTAAVLLEVSKVGFGLYITAFPTYETIYGALSAIPIFLLWLYTAWSVVLLGAEVAAALPEWRAGKITQVGPEGLLSAQRIVIAIAILGELHHAARLGVGIRRRTLAHRVPVGMALLDGMLEQLRAAHWVARTSDGAWMASRDLGTATIEDLRRSLGMAVRGNVRTVGHLSAEWQDRLADLFEQAEGQNRAILSVPVASLFGATADARPQEGQPPKPALRRTS